MRLNEILFFITTSLIISVSQVVYAESKHNDLALNIGPFTNIPSENEIIDGTLLTGNWDTNRIQPYFCLDTDNGFDRQTAKSIRTTSGIQARFERINYDVFETTHSGVGWIMSVTNKDNDRWLPILAGQETKIFEGSPSYGLGAKVKLSLVKIPGRFPNGVVTLPAQDLAHISCYRNGSVIEVATIRLSSVTMEFKARSCRVQTGTQTLQMGTYTRQSFSNLAVGQNLGTGISTNINLSCEKDVVPFVTISDNNQLGNESNIISLKSPDATTTAKGVGYQVFFDNQLQSLGPKSASVGNKNQFQINPITTMNNQTVPIALLFKYVKTSNNIVAGDANASVTLTFSYQ
ncbi:fimbrial protein [Proteus vulgaris]|uniref:Fimbrial protein n=1 Tax=Proteus vulgaris TaxID=585 RepID=A0A6G6SG97_PROVU|nr:fimbrial protein [Proteus vulgaris]QIF93543.1 fimbrial protein [Proteus vulgaris]WIF73540.1 fimbrial protein [Proteus vulgaris]CRL63101.1 F17a-G fimbrial adhesin precursor [Proteus vulgaris]